MTTDWNPLLRHEFEQPYWKSLQSFVALERQHHAVYPPQADVFAALHRTSHAETKVVVLGQDPYHGRTRLTDCVFRFSAEFAHPPHW